MEKLLVGKVEKQQAAWEKPKNAVEPAEEEPAAPKKQVIGNGGEWALNMPASIIEGGSGAGHWAAKQAKRDIASGEEDKAKVEKAEAKVEAEKEAEKDKKAGKKAEEPAEAKAEEKKAVEPEAKAEEKAAGEKAPEAPKADAKTDAPADKADV